MLKKTNRSKKKRQAMRQKSFVAFLIVFLAAFPTVFTVISGGSSVVPKTSGMGERGANNDRGERERERERNRNKHQLTKQAIGGCTRKTMHKT